MSHIHTHSSLVVVLALLLALLVVTVHARRLPLVTNQLHKEIHLSSSSSSSPSSSEGPRFDVLIFLKSSEKEQEESKNAESIHIDAMAEAMVRQARRMASESQQPILSFLQQSVTGADRQSGMHVSSLWISNAITVHRLPLKRLEEVIQRFSPLIDRIASDSAFRPHSTSVEFEAMLDSRLMAGVKRQNVSNIEWNLPWVQATDMWSRGFVGKGITVGVADTGIQYDHPALIEHYRGNLGQGRFNHHYNWWDAIKVPLTPQPGPCGINATVPCDDNGHGTHCTGTVLGATADGSRQIGVAPGAKFVGCRNMHNGVGRPSNYISCLQFFAAPTDLAGRHPDVSKRPHVISNSYICVPSEGCDPESLREATQFVRKSGIFMSCGAGNDGPACSTINSPPALQDDVYTIAALAHQSNSLATFSSRGPITVDGSRRAKPDIAAPGQGIMSAFPKDNYRSLSGTSMATPHVAGVVALLWDAVPSLQRNVDLTERILSESALPIPSRECGSPQDVPNHLFGHGGVRAFEAYSIAKTKI